MINKANSIKLSVADIKVRFVVCAPNESELTVKGHAVQVACQTVRQGLNEWMYAQDVS